MQKLHVSNLTLLAILKSNWLIKYLRVKRETIRETCFLQKRVISISWACFFLSCFLINKYLKIVLYIRPCQMLKFDCFHFRWYIFIRLWQTNKKKGNWYNRTLHLRILFAVINNNMFLEICHFFGCIYFVFFFLRQVLNLRILQVTGLRIFLSVLRLFVFFQA